MKNSFMILALFPLLCLSQVNSKHHHVNGHYKKNGTYVNGYERTNPNGTNQDNYSTEGNTNPYTGKEGTVIRDNNNPQSNIYYSYNYFTGYTYMNHYQTSYYVGKIGAKRDFKPKWFVFTAPFVASSIYIPLGLGTTLSCNIFRQKIKPAGHRYQEIDFTNDNFYYNLGYRKKAKKKIFWQSTGGLFLGIINNFFIKNVILKK